MPKVSRALYIDSLGRGEKGLIWLRAPDETISETDAGNWGL